MVLGTASGVGKSLITAGFCRLFSDWGYRVAPFKAQNMSNNSYVTEEGGEIGRAQAVQAWCARVSPSIDMNPILLKPSQDNCSQVILRGKAIGHFAARQYYGKRELLERAIGKSYGKLAANHELIIIEGAGSPAEVNLKKYDLVNMKMAEMADARCVLVADIDRGGVFAAVIGTLDLLEPDERERIDGIIINKFRGDQSLFNDGVEFIEKRTGKKVWGVVPYDRDLWIEEEDALPASIDRHRGITSPRPSAVPRNDILDIAVILLSRMSNFTDFEILRQEPGVRLRYVKRVEEIGAPDLLILPGTKATLHDFQDLTARGFIPAILNFAAQGGRILGICGGYQMMGKIILDPQNIESEISEIEGLGFFNMTTEFMPEKVVRQVREEVAAELFGQKTGGRIEAYEIHMGVTAHHENYPAFGKGGAVHFSGRLAGTYYHGLFDHPEFRASFLTALARSAGKPLRESHFLSAADHREIHFNRLRDLLARHLDLEAMGEALNLRHSEPRRGDPKGTAPRGSQILRFAQNDEDAILGSS